MMQNYRNIVWIPGCFPDQFADNLNQPFVDLERLLQVVDNEIDFGNKKPERRLKSMQKTKIRRAALSGYLWNLYQSGLLGTQGYTG